MEIVLGTSTYLEAPAPGLGNLDFAEVAAHESARTSRRMLIACATHSWTPPLTASWAAKRARGDQPIVCQQVADDKGKAAVGAAVAAAALTAASVSGVNGIFGVLDNTADELADILGVEDVPPVVASAVRALSPTLLIKAVSPSCCGCSLPEFSEMLDMNDCLLLPSRVFWSKTGAQPITIQQTMTTSEMWQVSTGSTVWGGGVVLQRYLESLGTDFWQGKSVIELGTGTGLGGVTAARLPETLRGARDRPRRCRA